MTDEAGIAQRPPTVRLRVVTYCDYDADPRHYKTDDPVKMAAIDTENFIANDANLGVFFDDVKVVVVPLETT